MEDRVRSTLRKHPRRFLAGWIEYLGIAARGHYPRATPQEENRADVLICMNELVIVLAKQLRSMDLEKIAYPEDALIETLFTKGDIRREACVEDLLIATRWALEEVGE